MVVSSSFYSRGKKISQEVKAILNHAVDVTVKCDRKWRSEGKRRLKGCSLLRHIKK